MSRKMRWMVIFFFSFVSLATFATRAGAGENDLAGKFGVGLFKSVIEETPALDDIGGVAVEYHFTDNFAFQGFYEMTGDFKGPGIRALLYADPTSVGRFFGGVGYFRETADLSQGDITLKAEGNGLTLCGGFLFDVSPNIKIGVEGDYSMGNVKQTMSYKGYRINFSETREEQQKYWFAVASAVFLFGDKK